MKKKKKQENSRNADIVVYVNFYYSKWFEGFHKFFSNNACNGNESNLYLEKKMLNSAYLCE